MTSEMEGPGGSLAHTSKVTMSPKLAFSGARWARVSPTALTRVNDPPYTMPSPVESSTVSVWHPVGMQAESMVVSGPGGN